MSVRTKNKYGKITISDYAVAMVANHAATDCYGVHELVSRKLTDSLLVLFNKLSSTKGVKVETVDNKIFVEIYAVLKGGVNVDAVKESVSDTVKFQIESFTGMRVGNLTVNVVGVMI